MQKKDFSSKWEIQFDKWKMRKKIHWIIATEEKPRSIAFDDKKPEKSHFELQIVLRMHKILLL